MGCNEARYGIMLSISTGEIKGLESGRRNFECLLSLYTMCSLIKYLPMPAWSPCDLTGLPRERTLIYESEN